MKRFTLLAIASLFSIGALAQTNIETNTGARAVATTAPIAVGVDINMPSTPEKQAVEYSGKQTVKTTGMAYLAGMAVSSGGFNCGGTAGLAVGGAGFSASAGGSKSLDECVKLNLLNFAGLAGDKELYEAVWCTMPAGKEAFAEMGKQCPADRRAAEQQRAQTTLTGAAAPAGRVTASNTSDPIIRARLSGN